MALLPAWLGIRELSLLLRELGLKMMSAWSTEPPHPRSGAFPLEELPPALSQGNSELRWDPRTKSCSALSSPKLLPPRIEGALELWRAWPGSCYPSVIDAFTWFEAIPQTIGGARDLVFGFRIQ